MSPTPTESKNPNVKPPWKSETIEGAVCGFLVTMAVIFGQSYYEKKIPSTEQLIAGGLSLLFTAKTIRGRLSAKERIAIAPKSLQDEAEAIDKKITELESHPLAPMIEAILEKKAAEYVAKVQEKNEKT